MQNFYLALILFSSIKALAGLDGVWESEDYFAKDKIVVEDGEIEEYKASISYKFDENRIKIFLQYYRIIDKKKCQKLRKQVQLEGHYVINEMKLVGEKVIYEILIKQEQMKIEKTLKLVTEDGVMRVFENNHYRGTLYLLLEEKRDSFSCLFSLLGCELSKWGSLKSDKKN